MLFTKLVEHELHEENIITDANIKFAKFCDALAEQSQEIQDYVLVSSYLTKSLTYKLIIPEHRTLLQNAIIDCVDEAIERLNIQQILEINCDHT
jgi:hypothetical protein